LAPSLKLTIYLVAYYNIVDADGRESAKTMKLQFEEGQH
jgi:hypothetical protein